MEWCLKNNHVGWIDAQAKTIHNDLISKHHLEKIEEEKNKEKLKTARKEKKQEKKKRPESLEDKVIENIRKRTRK